MKSKYIIGLVILAMLALSLGCRLTSLVDRPGEAVAAIPPTRTPKPTFTVTSTFTPRPTATDTPTTTPTPLPTDTPAPPTDTPVPTDTPAPTKPPPPPPTEPPAEQPPAEEQSPAEPAEPQGCAYQFCPGPWYGGDPNAGLTRFYGHIKDQSGNMLNGFFIRAACGGYQVISFPSGPWEGGPNTEPGFYDIAVRNEPISLDCTLQVVMYECGHWFDATCQQFTPLSEAVHVKTDAAAGETIVIADWICYHDCTAPKRPL